MDTNNVCSPPSEEDLRAALKDMKAYMDVTEEDLKKIYEIALRHARARVASLVPVKDIMSTNVVTIKRDDDIHEAARLLSENRISGMPVVDVAYRVIGVVSEADVLLLAGLRKEHTFKDVLRKILGEPVSARTTNGKKVGDVMSIPPITCTVDDTITDVAKILDERRIKRLPVVDREGKLVGIISRADIVRAMGSRA